MTTLGGARRGYVRTWTNPYITDGLICHIDGIWKEAGGVESSSVESPVDLTGGLMFQYSIPSYNATAQTYRDDNHPFYEFGSNVTFEDDAFVFSGNNSGIIGPATDQRSWDGLTIEIAFKHPPQNNVSIGWSYAGSPYRPMILFGNGFYYIGGSKSSIASGLCFSLAKESSDTNRGVGFVDGVEYSRRDISQTSVDTGYNGMTPNFFRVHQYGSNNNGIYNMGAINSKVHVIRVYNRQLTADEIAANYAVDKARFKLT